MSKILLCGYGNIGKRMYPEYCKMGEVVVIDTKKSTESSIHYIDNWEDVDSKFDFAILCLPTPTVNGQCDTSIVESVINYINTNNLADTIVIRSTVTVGFTKSLCLKNVVFAPEFYGTTQHQAVDDFLILGGDREYTNKVAQLYYKIKKGDFKIKFYEDPTVPEIIKYTENSFLATKVVFCNEIAKVCKLADVEYDDVREGWLLDSRVNPSHTIVYKDTPYYDSHCFNKDIPAFANQFNINLLKQVHLINEQNKLTKNS